MAWACSRPEPAGQVDGTLDGTVFITAPVGGVVVTAYRYDKQSCALGAEITHFDPTTADGAFHLDPGIYFWPGGPCRARQRRIRTRNPPPGHPSPGMQRRRYARPITHGCCGRHAELQLSAVCRQTDSATIVGGWGELAECAQRPRSKPRCPMARVLELLSRRCSFSSKIISELDYSSWCSPSTLNPAEAPYGTWQALRAGRSRNLQGISLSSSRAWRPTRQREA